MTDLTTARLQRLLDGSSPGPWTAKNDDDWNETIVANECGHALTWGDQVRFKMEAGDTNTDPHLAALAPELAQELIRLRERIEDLITAMEDKATTGESQSPAIIAGYLKEVVLGETND